MRRWALITVGLYVVLVIVLTVPVGALAFAGSVPVSEVAHVFTMWWYWLALAVLALCQLLLLVVPVRAAVDIRIRQRHIAAPLVTAGLLAAVLVAAFVGCLLAVIFADDSIWDILVWVLVGLVAAGWVFWALRFRKYASLAGEPAQFMDRITHTLFKGSILELLVAVACHIVVRARGDCSAPVATFVGIAAGVAVMLLAFGPGVFYLFAKRRKQMMSRKQREESGLA